jgi:hypothetical protein
MNEFLTQADKAIQNKKVRTTIIQVLNNSRVKVREKDPGVYSVRIEWMDGMFGAYAIQGYLGICERESKLSPSSLKLLGLPSGLQADLSWYSLSRGVFCEKDYHIVLNLLTTKNKFLFHETFGCRAFFEEGLANQLLNEFIKGKVK